MGRFYFNRLLIKYFEKGSNKKNKNKNKVNTHMQCLKYDTLIPPST